MTNLKNKVNEKITELKAKGVDTAEAEAFVATAGAKLNEAKDKIAEMNTLLASSIEKLTLEQKTELRKLAQETQTLLVESHRALRDAVKSLKDAVKAKMENEGDDDGNE